MTTFGERLRDLSGLTGVTVGAHLRAISGLAAGATVGAALLAYSGLPAGQHTVAEHLLVNHAAADLREIARLDSHITRQVALPSTLG